MYTRNTQSGFTLIEMIVSLGVFSVVLTVSVGALLMLVAANQRLQMEQSVMTNLSFALDSMTREIRTGTAYYCASSNTRSGVFDSGGNLDSLVSGVADCAGGNSSDLTYHGLAFKEGGDSVTGASDAYILYYYDSTDGKIYRKVGNGQPQSIVSDGIFIKKLEFFVTGSATLRTNSTNRDQAVVTLYLEAAETSTSPEVYRVQTTVTQRALDL